MNRGLFFFLALLLVAGGPVFSADSLQKARFTEVIRDVRVTKANTTDMREAKVNDTFEVPEVIRTGMDSRAELEAPDKTIARIGANTIFSFEAAKRTMNLQSGSVLFHSPKGMGGGTIKTAAATAAVTGTTIMVGATSNGGFKIMVLEGKSRVTHPSGDSKQLNAGQMTFLIPGKNVLGPSINFDLQRATQNSALLQGFSKEVASKEKISGEVEKQQKSIKEGKEKDTNVELVDIAENGPVVVLDSPKQPDPDVRGGDAPTAVVNSFPDLLNYLNSHTGTLTLTQSTFDNVFTSNDRATGTYNGFKVDTIGSYAALGGGNINFSNVAYDLSSYKNLKTFGFVSSGNMTFNTTLGSMSFSNAPDSLKFVATGGALTFSGTSSITSSSKEISFEALGNISNGTESTFISSVGTFEKFDMISKNGNISLTNPVFNSKITNLTADTITLTSLNMPTYTGTGAKTLNVYTSSGNWYYFGSGGGSTVSGAFTLLSPTGGSSPTNTSGGAGTQVNDSVTTYQINSYKK